MFNKFKNKLNIWKVKIKILKKPQKLRHCIITKTIIGCQFLSGWKSMTNVNYTN